MPERKHFQSKQLAQQVRNIKIKKLLNDADLQALEKEYKTLTSQEQNNSDTYEEENGDYTPGDDNLEREIPSRHEQELHTTENENNESVEEGMLKEEIREIWKRNFGKYITTDISKREYNVNIKPSPNEKYLKIADEIVAEELEKIKTEYVIDMWTLNVIYYTTAVSVLEKEGRLREIKRNAKINERPGWQIRLESRIGALRRKISHTYVLIECNRTKAYSKHQKEIKRKFEKQYGKATINNLNATITKLKQNLTVESEKLKRRKSIRERKYVNGIFKVSPKRFTEK